MTTTPQLNHDLLQCQSKRYTKLWKPQPVHCRERRNPDSLTMLMQMIKLEIQTSHTGRHNLWSSQPPHDERCWRTLHVHRPPPSPPHPHAPPSHLPHKYPSCGGARLDLRGRRVQTELDKDDAVLDHGTQRAQQPGQGADKVVRLLRVRDDASTVRKVARQGQQEEQQRQPLARLFLVVLDDLRDAGAMTS